MEKEYPLPGQLAKAEKVRAFRVLLQALSSRTPRAAYGRTNRPPPAVELDQHIVAAAGKAAVCEACVSGPVKNHIYMDRQKRKGIFLFLRVINELKVKNLVTPGSWMKVVNDGLLTLRGCLCH